jgi:hypothetical protein
MGRQQGSAFITTRKGVCYLTLKCDGRNFHITRIRNYTLDAEDKRDMRRLYPEVVFDWKKIARQLAEKREVCRRYRSRRRAASTERRARLREPFYGVYDPAARAVYVEGDMTAAAGFAFLDAILSVDRRMKEGGQPGGGCLVAEESAP